MVAPMVVLGLGAVVIGYVINPQWINFLTVPVHWVTGFVADAAFMSPPGERDTPSCPSSTGPSQAYPPPPRWAGRCWDCWSTVCGETGRGSRSNCWGRSTRCLSQKYYVDALYEGIIVRRSFYRVFAGLTNWLDRRIVDGFVDLVGWLFRNIGSAIGRLQTGQAQTYATVVALGSLLIVLGFLLA